MSTIPEPSPARGRPSRTTRKPNRFQMEGSSEDETPRPRPPSPSNEEIEDLAIHMEEDQAEDPETPQQSTNANRTVLEVPDSPDQENDLPETRADLSRLLRQLIVEESDRMRSLSADNRPRQNSPLIDINSPGNKSPEPRGTFKEFHTRNQAPEGRHQQLK